MPILHNENVGDTDVSKGGTNFLRICFGKRAAQPDQNCIVLRKKFDRQLN